MYPQPIIALDMEIQEDTIKAIYSFKFGKFSEWPESKLRASETRLNFCILGENPFTRVALDAIEGKSVKGRKLQIKNYPRGLLSEDALDACHIVYVGQSEQLRQKSIIKSLANKPILTVSDITGFSQSGGMITLVKTGQQVHFEINPDAIARAGLRISSKLLELAKVIYEENSGEGL